MERPVESSVRGEMRIVRMPLDADLLSDEFGMSRGSVCGLFTGRAAVFCC